MAARYATRLLASTSIDAGVLRRALCAAEDRRISRARAGGAFVMEDRKIIHSPPRGSKSVSDALRKYWT